MLDPLRDGPASILFDATAMLKAGGIPAKGGEVEFTSMLETRLKSMLAGMA